MHYRSGFLAVLIIVVATATVTFWYTQQPNKAEEQTATNFNNSVAVVNNASTTANTNALGNTAAVTEEDPIADWKTYTNSTYGFTVRYPQDWTLTEVTDEASLTAGEVIRIETPETIQKRETTEQFLPLDGVTVSFWENINNEYARGGTTTETTTYKNLEDFFAAGDQLKKKVGETTLGGKKAYDVHISGLGQYYVVTAENKGIYEVGFQNADTKEALTDLQKQVLATFEFTK